MIIKINKELKKPIYSQIVESITALIEAGILQEGDKLPTEKELCDAYEISHSVVLNAYQILLEKDLIERVKGQGTYVKNHFKIELNLETLFKTVLDHSGYEVHSVYQDTFNEPDFYNIKSNEIKVEYLVLSKNQVPFSVIKLYIDHKLVGHYDYVKTLNEHIQNQTIIIESWFQGVNIQSPNTFFLNETKSIPGYLITSEIIQNNETKGIIKSFFHGKLVKVEEAREIIQL